MGANLVETLDHNHQLIEDDRPHEECGVFGIYLPTEVASVKANLVVDLAFNGIFQNQHRGEESAGFATANGYEVSPIFKNLGLVAKVRCDYLNDADHSQYNGHIAVAHTRYSTTGSSTRNNAGPFGANSEKGTIVASHNGNLTNAGELKQFLLADDVVFKSTTDSEIIADMIAHTDGKEWEDKISDALSKFEGSFSLVLMTKSALYAARDNIGNRPLFWAEFDDENSKKIYAVSSETPAFFHLNGYKLIGIHEMTPGTVIKFNKSGVSEREFKKQEEDAFCGLEITYLSRADGKTRNEKQIDTVRRALGAKLALLYPPPENITDVTYIPESSRPAAEGFAEALSLLWNRSIPCKTSLIKGRYPNMDGKVRGFISPTDNYRKSVASNYYPMDWVYGKDLVVIDDSLIRGKTTGGVIETYYNAGAKKIHLRIPWPTVGGYCPLGTDINANDKLIYETSGRDIETMRKIINVTTLAFLTPKEYQQTVDEVIGEHFGLCMGCTDGKYPVTIFQADKAIFERKC
jgi:amidophosphoribosyltransferase